MQPIKNCFSVDVEGFVESNLESFHIDKKYIDRQRENFEIEKNTEVLLELLNQFNVHATFFFLGRVARDLPQLVRTVAGAGHEVASHSYEHLRLFGISRQEFREKLEASKKLLEDLSGNRICGFRAPDFSITNSSRWALDVLLEAGFLYDSSIYPIGMHDVYGMKNAHRFIHRLPNGLIEFPLSTVEILGKRFPFGGGGYFRIYPLAATRLFISGWNQLGHPCMFYIHPYEVGPIIPKINELPWHRKFRHYHHCENGHDRLKTMLENFTFVPAVEILRQGDFLEKN